MTSSPDLWDGRISRARQLADEATATKELLTFYVALLEQQQAIYEALRAVAIGSPSADLAADLRVLKQYFRSFLQSASSVAPPSLAQQAMASDELLLEYWQTRSDKIFSPKPSSNPTHDGLLNPAPSVATHKSKTVAPTPKKGTRKLN
ncbi:MAG: hypothetical protein LC794_05935 [Acidobacteria bacterium]|nr:hypothetical protein [Acidobacteriota bacterium]